MAKKEKLNLMLQTVPNGYVLKVDDQEFMFFNEIDLLAGFMNHVGMGYNTPQDKGTILSGLFAAMLGDAYADAVTTLKQRVGLLTSQYTTTIERMDAAIDYVTKAEKQIEGLANRIKTTEEAMKAVEQLHAANKKEVGDTNARLTMIETRMDEMNKRAEDVFNQLANILTTKQVIEEAKKEKEKAEAEEGAEKPSKSKKSTGEDKKKSPKTRKERDEAILEKAKKNKDIK
jgi:cysteinyl-tRNA synthetase